MQVRPHQTWPQHFLLAQWRVDVAARRIDGPESSMTLEPLVMNILQYLCMHPMEVVSSDRMLEACWGNPLSGDNPVHKAMAVLRKALGDSPRSPRFIETVRLRGYRLIASVQVLTASGPRAHQRTWGNGSPFMGLASYDTEHASIYFGRDAAIDDLYQRLSRQWSRAHPFVVVLGASGSGKTSLVQAGLIPLLLQNRTLDNDALAISCHAVLDLADVEHEEPLRLLAGTILDWEYRDQPLLSGYSIDSLCTALRADTASVIKHLRQGLPSGSGRPLPPLLVLDSLEAALAGDRREALGDWIAALTALIRSHQVLVVALCRNDFYGSLAQHPVFMHDKDAGSHMDLLAPDGEALAQIVRLPAQAAGLSFGRDPSGLQQLDDKIYSDALRARDALPLLQYALQTLYEARAPGEMLSWELYERLGGLDGAITNRAESILSRLPAEQRDAFPALLAKLVRLDGEEIALAARWCPCSEIRSSTEAALMTALVEARLLTSSLHRGVRSVRVAHEALLRQWQRITVWLQHHRSTLAALEELAAWNKRWLASQRANSCLLPRSHVLWQAVFVLNQQPSLCPDDIRFYIQQSQARMRTQTRLRCLTALAMLALSVLSVSAAIRYAQMAHLAQQREQQSRKLSSFMLGELADKLRPMGRLDLLGSIGQQGIAVWGGADLDGESPQDTLQRAKALVVAAEVNSTRGKGSTATALRALDEADRLLAHAPPLPATNHAEYYKTRGASAFWRGQIAFDQGQLEAARKAMSAYRDICLQWQAYRPSELAAVRELGFALNSLGSIAVRNMAWQQASQYFQSALQTKQAVLAVSPHDQELVHSVANAHTWLGQVQHALGRDDEALAGYDEALKLESGLYFAQPDEKARLHELAVLQVRRAEALDGLGRYAEAITALQSGNAWLVRAVQHDAANLRWRAEHMHLGAGLLLARLNQGGFTQARAELSALNAWLTRDTQAFEKQPRLQHETLARLALIRALIANLEGQFSTARIEIDSSWRQLDELAKSSPPSWQNLDLAARLVLATQDWIRQSHPAPATALQACRELEQRARQLTPLAQAAITIKARAAVAACVLPISHVAFTP